MLVEQYYLLFVKSLKSLLIPRFFINTKELLSSIFQIIKQRLGIWQQMPYTGVSLFLIPIMLYSFE